MKLYEAQPAPNCRRVRMFLAEKGIDVDIEPVDIVKMENRQEPYLSKNPMGGVPMLELDDGTYLAESRAICRYFEELQPEPALMGTTPQEKAEVEMWERRMEFEVALPIMNAFRHGNKFFEGRIEQVADYGAASKRQAIERLKWLDGVLADRDYVAGDQFTIADITALIGIDFGRVVQLSVDDFPNVKAWHERVSESPERQGLTLALLGESAVELELGGDPLHGSEHVADVLP